jgi:hypothetical protein
MQPLQPTQPAALPLADVGRVSIARGALDVASLQKLYLRGDATMAQVGAAVLVSRSALNELGILCDLAPTQQAVLASHFQLRGRGSRSGIGAMCTLVQQAAQPAQVVAPRFHPTGIKAAASDRHLKFACLGGDEADPVPAESESARVLPSALLQLRACALPCHATQHTPFMCPCLLRAGFDAFLQMHFNGSRDPATWTYGRHITWDLGCAAYKARAKCV